MEMATYTIELGTLIERGYDIFDFDYPLFDDDYKLELETKIVDKFYYREIGMETPDRFKRYLRSKMQIIMPYYNNLYKSTLIELDIFSNEEGRNHSYKETTDKAKRETENKYDSNNLSSDRFNGRQTRDLNTVTDDVNNTISKGDEVGSKTVNTNNHTIEDGTKDIHTENENTTNTKGNSERTTEGTQDYDGENKILRNDTPQGKMDNPFSNNYATQAEKADQANNTKTTGKETIVNSEDKTYKGSEDTDETNHITTDFTGLETTSTRLDTNNKVDYTGNVKEVENAVSKDTNYRNKNDRFGSLGLFSDSSKQDGTEKVTNKYFGRKNISQSELLIIYRSALINVDLMVMEELEPLFMGVL